MPTDADDGGEGTARETWTRTRDGDEPSNHGADVVVARVASARGTHDSVALEVPPWGSSDHACQPRSTSSARANDVTTSFAAETKETSCMSLAKRRARRASYAGAPPWAYAREDAVTRTARADHDARRRAQVVANIRQNEKPRRAVGQPPAPGDAAPREWRAVLGALAAGVTERTWPTWTATTRVATGALAVPAFSSSRDRVPPGRSPRPILPSRRSTYPRRRLFSPPTTRASSFSAARGEYYDEPGGADEEGMDADEAPRAPRAASTSWTPRRSRAAARSGHTTPYMTKYEARASWAPARCRSA